MSDDKTAATFTNTCVKCDKPMISKDGKRIGGIIDLVNFDDEFIFSTTCWECSLEHR